MTLMTVKRYQRPGGIVKVRVSVCRCSMIVSVRLVAVEELTASNLLSLIMPSSGLAGHSQGVSDDNRN